MKQETLKTTASETEVGKIHKKVTTIINKGLDKVLVAMDSENEVEALLAAESKTLNIAVKWCEINSVTAHLETDDKASATSQKLADIKKKFHGNVVSFTDPERETG